MNSYPHELERVPEIAMEAEVDALEKGFQETFFRTAAGLGSPAG